MLFADYPYHTRHARTMVRHLADLARAELRHGDAVLEIGSNDGTFLQAVRRHGARGLGVDPAAAPAAVAAAAGLDTVTAFFDRGVAEALRADRGRFDVVVGTNVLAHVPDPNELVSGMAAVLAPGGRIVLEVPALERLVAAGAIDTIYHEHHAVFSARALTALARRHGLRIDALERVDVHGGSWRVRLVRGADRAMLPPGPTAADLAPLFARSAAFDARVLDAVAGMPRVGGYGAAAKATMLVNRLRLGVDRLPWIADVNPAKHGRFLPGTGQRVVAPDVLLAAAPPLCLVFAWNLIDEVEQSALGRRYRARGGRFVPTRPRQSLAWSASATGSRVSGAARTAAATPPAHPLPVHATGA